MDRQKDLTELRRLDSRGAQSVESFCALLRRRYGSVAAAWRLALDTNGKGKVSFIDFCKVTRDMGYSKNVKGIWAELDADGNGFISLNELDAEAAETLDSFRSLLRETFGSTLQGWKFLDVDGNRRLDLHELEERCGRLGYKGNVRFLFNCLRVDVGRQFITLSDLDPAAHIAAMRGDYSMMTEQKIKKLNLGASQSLPSLGRCPSSSSSSPSEATKGAVQSTMNAEWTRQRSLEQIKEQYERKKAHKDKDVAMKSIEELKRFLVGRFGNIFSAWRQALDLDGNGRLSFGEFCLAMRELGYGGNTKAAWHTLDADNDGFIQLSDFDPRAEKMINGYKKVIKRRFGNMLNGWLECLSKDGNGTVDKAAFEKHCKAVEWSGNVPLLFESLKNDKGRNLMTLRDYDIAAYNAYLREDFGMLTEGENSLPIVNMNFLERQANTFRHRWAQAQAKAIKEGHAAMLAEEKSKSKACDDVDAMKELLLKKYWTITSAWRHCFEDCERGRVFFIDFCNAMRKLGYAGNIKKCFHRLDTDDKGHITLEDLDPEANEIVSEFRKFLLDKYGNYIKAWAALDQNRNNQLEEHELKEVCRQIGFQRDTKVLFRYLLDGPGRKFISLGDLDPAAMRAYYRGEPSEPMSKAERAKAELQKKKEEREKEKSLCMGATDKKTMKRELIRKYGTITAAWRYCLDPEICGKISFSDFCKAARNISFIGDIQACFDEFDDDASGIITFNEVDKKWYQRLSTFQEKLLETYKTYESAWRAIDTDKSNAIDCEEFVRVCEEIGLGWEAEECKHLFRQLLKSPGERMMAFDDLFVGGVIMQGADRNVKDMVVKADDDLLSSNDAAKRERQRRVEEMQTIKEKRMGARDTQSLKKEWAKHYGSLTAAWRYALDITGNGKVSLVDFSRAARGIGFQGDIKKCFEELDEDGSGIITFNELDPKWYKRLANFQELLLGKYKSYESAWKALDANGNNQIDCEEMVNICGELGCSGSAEEAAQLFKQLLKVPTQKFISLEDLQIGGVITKAAAPHGSFSFALRDSDLRSKDENARLEREAWASKEEEERGKDSGCNNWTQLKNHLLCKYGTITAVWRNHFDKRNTGKLPLKTFLQSLRDVAFRGDAKACFREIDADGIGVVTFEEVDSTWCAKLAPFHALLLERYGTYQNALADRDLNGNGIIEEYEFVALCAELGYEGNPRYLFKQHLAAPGQSAVTFEDIKAVGKIVEVAASSSDKRASRSRQVKT